MFQSIETQRELSSLAHDLADAARPIALKYFRESAQSLENKQAGGFDPVTAADRGIEARLREILQQRRPQDGVLGEEFAPIPSRSGFTWVLDPIDGTRGFISGTPTWGVLIALNDGSGPVLGVIDQPFTGERYIGGFGAAELQRGSQARPIQTRNCASLDAATMFSTFPEVGSSQERAAFERVRDRVKLTRYGLDCYAYALVASGQIDLVIEAGLKPYDIQAPIAVIEAAGGIVTNWQGGPAHDGGQVLAAGDNDLHRQALAIINANAAKTG